MGKKNSAKIFNKLLNIGKHKVYKGENTELLKFTPIYRHPPSPLTLCPVQHYASILCDCF